MPVIPIDTLDDPRLAPYRALKATNLTRWSGRFIAEGRKVVERLVNSSYPTESLLVSTRQLHYLPDLTDHPELPVYAIPPDQAEQLLGFQFHAGILGCGIRNHRATLDELLTPVGPRRVVVAADRLTDPENLGTLIRLCTGFGVSGLLLGPGCADPFSRRTLRVSMGNLLRLPVRESTDLLCDLRELRSRGLPAVATVLDPRAIPLTAFQPPASCVLLLGNESVGLSPEIVAASEHLVTIPMHHGTDSLNVSIAAAITLYALTSYPVGSPQPFV